MIGLGVVAAAGTYSGATYEIVTLEIVDDTTTPNTFRCVAASFFSWFRVLALNAELHLCDGRWKTSSGAWNGPYNANKAVTVLTAGVSISWANTVGHTQVRDALTHPLSFCVILLPDNRARNGNCT